MRVGLLGINAGSTAAWCVEARRLIAEADPLAEVWDPEDPAWSTIDWNSGDEVQSAVDGIVDRQLEGISACDALLVCLVPDQPGLGARFEFGRILWTPGLKLHVVIDGDVMGRHYVRGFYRHALAGVEEFPNIAEAVAAIFQASAY